MTKNLTRSCSAIALSLILCAGGAGAAELRKDLTVQGDLITVGDLFTDAGENMDTPAFEAPAPGKSKTISAYDLERIAKQYNLDWQRPDYLKRVAVTRLSSNISPMQVEELVLETAISQGASADSMIRFFGRNNGFVVPVDTTVQDLEFEQFHYNASNNRFTAVVRVPSGTDIPDRVSLSGMIEEVRHIPVLNRNIVPDETIKDTDISWLKVPATKINGRTIASSKQLVGMTVRRALRPDTPIMSNDIMTPVAVDKGAPVTMLVRTNAMILTASGRALEDGGIGDTIRVLNTKSRLTVDARVVSSGQVEIIAAPSLALNGR